MVDLLTFKGVFMLTFLVKSFSKYKSFLLTIIIVLLGTTSINAQEIKTEQEYKVVLPYVIKAYIKAKIKSTNNTTKKKSSAKKLFKKISVKPSTSSINYKRLLNKYKKSRGFRNTISKEVQKASKEFGIPEKLLLAVLIRESSLNPLLVHSRVKVKTPKGRKVVNAVGLGGIIWEIHYSKLKKLGIYSRSQLFNVRNNIRATAAILEIYSKWKRIPGTSNKWQSALVRYYGVVWEKRNGKKVLKGNYLAKIKRDIRRI